jgi:hypothetical protein
MTVAIAAGSGILFGVGSNRNFRVLRPFKTVIR